jgi:hypothetical protein
MEQQVLKAYKELKAHRAQQVLKELQVQMAHKAQLAQV